MSSHLSVHDEIKEQHAKTKNMTREERLSYFWYYYKVHTIVAVIAIILISIFIYQFATNKDYGFYAAIINADMTNLEDNQWEQEFEEYADIDTRKYMAAIDTSIVLDDNDFTQYAMTNREKLLAMLQIGMVDIFVVDMEHFENYAQYDYFMDLEKALTPELLAEYQDYFYYTDIASIDMRNDSALDNEDEVTDPAALTINHRDPSTMEHPAAVGICVPQDSKLGRLGCYDYLANTTYQGYPSYGVIGIPANTERLETALKFLTFLSE